MDNIIRKLFTIIEKTVLHDVTINELIEAIKIKYSIDISQTVLSTICSDCIESSKNEKEFLICVKNKIEAKILIKKINGIEKSKNNSPNNEDDKTKDDKPKGDKPKGDKPKGDKPKGNKQK